MKRPSLLLFDGNHQTGLIVMNEKRFLKAGKKSGPAKAAQTAKEEKASELVSNIETRVVQLNERISDLKTWNIAQLNQVAIL